MVPAGWLTLIPREPVRLPISQEVIPMFDHGFFQRIGRQLTVAILVIAVASFSIGYGVRVLLGDTKTDTLPDITAKSLTIKGDDGKGSISMTVTDKGPGLWLTNPNGDHICITALNDGANHTVYLMKKGHNFGDIGLHMDSKGVGCIQFRDSKGQPRHLPLEKLADLPLDKLLEGVK